MKNKSTLFTVLLLLCSFFAVAQTGTVTGVVTEAATRNTAVGVTVIIKGTTTGTITDMDGKYILSNVPAKSTLVFSFIGMKTIEIPVDGRSRIDVKMEDDQVMLDNVVVVGYGTAKLKDLTSPIVNVKSEEIVKHATANPMQAMQGKVSGVQIVNSGEPGKGPTVRIRGIGSFNNENPLYVVDGMFFDNVDFLSNSDIESISVLKDASAASIYGVRAANGVVLITTKKGNYNKKTTITYNGYVGIQKATNVLDMANSKQYATMQYEKGDETSKALIQKSIEVYGGADGIPAVDTDWYDELLHTALIQSNSLDITGGSEKTAFSLGISHFSQEGIMDANSKYSRFNLSAKGDYKAYEWLKVGANLLMSDAKKNTPDNAAWQSAFVSPSIYPAYDENNTNAYPIRFGSPMSIGLSDYFGNPLAAAEYNEFEQNIVKITPSFYAEVGLLPENKLTFKTTYSQEIAFIRGKRFEPEFNVGGSQSRIDSKLTKSDDFYQNYIWDNTLTYKDQIGKHSYSVMAGASYRNEDWRMLKGWANNVPDGEDEYHYISQGDADSRRSEDDGTTYRGESYFGRITYNYADKYLLSATMRADGSSKYQEKWGYFPSLGLGWVVTGENFMSDQKWVDYMKLRASYGMLGNDKVPASDGFASIVTNLGTSGVFGDVLYPGYINQNYFSSLKWEVVKEFNVGMDVAFLANRLKAEMDYYHRLTDNAVIQTPLPMGAGWILDNSGQILNSGLEFSLNWSDKIGKDFNYHASVNLSTLNNEVKDLKGIPYLYGGSAEFRTITKVGESINSYYGYKVKGVYQTQDQVDNDPIAQKYGLQPGDLMYEDLNGDDAIDDKDRQILGSALPTFTYGGSVGFEWKNLDFGLTFMGVMGNEIVNQKRGTRRWQGDINYDADMVENRWTGEGSTNKYPSAAGSVRPWNVANFSSFFVEKGDFFRIQNIQLGYNFNKLGLKGLEGTKVRVYASADNPFTVFEYNGFTPEIASGFDNKVYPNYSTYTFGLKVTF